jgi:hypothetical protein
MTRGDAELAVDGLEAGDPEAGGLVVLSASFFSSPLRSSRRPSSGLLAVAVVGLVVDDHDVLHAHEVGHDALEHLAFGFQGVEFLAAASLQRRRPPLDNSRRSRSLKAW